MEDTQVSAWVFTDQELIDLILKVQKANDLFIREEIARRRRQDMILAAIIFTTSILIIRLMGYIP